MSDSVKLTRDDLRRLSDLLESAVDLLNAKDDFSSLSLVSKDLSAYANWGQDGNVVVTVARRSE